MKPVGEFDEFSVDPNVGNLMAAILYAIHGSQQNCMAWSCVSSMQPLSIANPLFTWVELEHSYREREDGSTKLLPYEDGFGSIDHSKDLILQVLSGQTQGSTSNLYDVVRVLLASGDNSVVTEIYIWHMLEGKCSTADDLVDGTSRQRQRATENEHELYRVKRTFEYRKPYLSSLIGVRETLLPSEKQFHTMERLFERLVAKTTLLEGEEKKKKGEHVRLATFLDKKEAQFWVMNEQSKVMTLIAFLDCKCYLKKVELCLNEVVGWKL
ncbi:hypothetical protein V6N13_106248 [Hibiscus sabdariffa]